MFSGSLRESGILGTNVDLRIKDKFNIYISVHLKKNLSHLKLGWPFPSTKINAFLHCAISLCRFLKMTLNVFIQMKYHQIIGKNINFLVLPFLLLLSILRKPYDLLSIWNTVIISVSLIMKRQGWDIQDIKHHKNTPTKEGNLNNINTWSSCLWHITMILSFR
jgi:hypothetical protein